MGGGRNFDGRQPPRPPNSKDNSDLPQHNHQKKRPYKIQNSHFCPIFNAYHQIKFQKNLINRFRKQLETSVDFGP